MIAINEVNKLFNFVFSTSFTFINIIKSLKTINNKIQHKISRPYHLSTAIWMAKIVIYQICYLYYTRKSFKYSTINSSFANSCSVTNTLRLRQAIKSKLLSVEDVSELKILFLGTLSIQQQYLFFSKIQVSKQSKILICFIRTATEFQLSIVTLLEFSY